MLIVSDSQYLVKGMREWVPGWVARGWRRKEGPIENLELWKALLASVPAARRPVDLGPRAHRDTPKNEYANDLAVLAAREQRTSEGIVESGFDDVADGQAGEGLYLDYDPDAAFAELEERLARGRPRLR